MSSRIETYSKDFDKTNHELKAYWEMGREAVRNVGIKINELVSILHKEHKDWSVSKIAYTIAAANDSLEGFSRKTIYNYLNNDNKALLDPGKQNQKQNNVLEDGGEGFHHNVTEESSSHTTTTRTLPTAYEVKDAETVHDIVDDDDDDEEEEDTQRIIQFKYNLEIRGEIFPVISTTYVETGTGKVELDEKELRRLYKKR